MLAFKKMINKIVSSFSIFLILLYISCNTSSKDDDRRNKHNPITTQDVNEDISIYDAEKELRSLDSIITSDKHNFTAIKNKVILLLEMKRESEAMKIEQQLVASEETPENITFLGIMYEKCNSDTIMANKLYEKSLHIYDSLLAKSPKNELADINRVQLILFLYGRERGMLEYEKLLKKYPNSQVLSNAKQQIFEVSREEFMNSLW
jgi:tetratricopeptide (TPR) repeat protein